MAGHHQFGGSWTEEKLNRVRKYLTAYTTIFTQNPRAATLRTFYVDAFAGTGYRTTSSQQTSTAPPLFTDEDAASLQQGSAAIALETEPPFDHYLFIEQACGCFLDPYGMEVAWATIEAIAQTHAIDLWLLFPLGQAVNRLLTRHGPPEEPWAQRLTRMFGTEVWKDAFYRASTQGTLFGADTTLEKDADFDTIGAFFVQRLATVFAQVVTTPLPLRNSKNVPIYLLCFAAGNPRGAPTAVKIARHILTR